ncbi:MAG: HEAT repeat domain-containing protein [Myxococcales bacterium]
MAADPPGRTQAADLLRAALEKVVFFEWRVAELAAQLVQAQERTTAATRAAERAAQERSVAEQRARMAESRTASAEAERARMSGLLAASREEPAKDRERIAELEAQLLEARAEIVRQREERDRWLSDMVAQARAGGDGPSALAEFIAELRGEVISLREQVREEEASPDEPTAAIETPREPAAAQPSPVRNPPAASILAPGAVAPASAYAPIQAAPAGGISSALTSGGSAARALSEQSLRQLGSSDPNRRAQAARNLASVPAPAAAPELAAALSRETDARVRGALALALVACGGEAAADLVVQLQGPPEPALVRLAALDALCGAGPERARLALEVAARDESPAVRRRAAMLAMTAEGAGDVGAALLRDADFSVRAAARPRAPQATPAPLATEPPAPAQPVDDGTRLASEAVAAVRAAIFGLSEEELARHLEMPPPDAAELAARLVGEGLVARRGRRLVATGAAEGGL